MAVLFAEFKGQQQFLATPTPIPGLSLTIPEGSGESALVILNVPASYAIVANWTNGQGGWFGLSLDGTQLPEYAAYNYISSMNLQNVQGRVPATLVVAVPMKLKMQKVIGLAQNCIIDSSASLSVIIA
jgi:mannose-binding lectin